MYSVPGITYGIRKWLSPGSIYTLKLLRRGHIVPEGLQAAMSESMTVQDIMVKAYTTVDAEAAFKPSEAPVLVTSGDAIVAEREVAASTMKEAELK